MVAGTAVVQPGLAHGWVSKVWRAEMVENAGLGRANPIRRHADSPSGQGG
jgi:hypothetical protein